MRAQSTITPKESPGAMQLAAGANSVLRITNASPNLQSLRGQHKT
jgi:hypothetical protein